MVCDSLDCGLYFERRKLAAELAAVAALAQAGLQHLEQQCLEWFQELGYTHVFAPQLDSDGTSAPES